MKKILLISNELNRSCGITTHLYYLIQGLKRANEFELVLLCPGGDNIKKFQNLNIQIIVNRLFNFEMRNVKQLTISTLYLLYIIKKYSISLIHSHNYFAANAAFLPGLLFNVPTVQTHHNLFPKGRLQQEIAQRQIIVNADMRNYLRRSDQILIHYGIFNNYQREKRSSSSKIKVIAASRLVYEKGLDVYIKAINLLPDDIRTNTEFYIAGKGEYEEKLKHLNKELLTNVTFLGNLDDLLRKLSEMDIFVAPSRWNAEGFPLTIIEAGYSKTLIIAANFRGLEEIFVNGEDGLIFNNGDFEDLSKKLQIAIREHSNLKILTENFYRKVNRIFNIEVMTAKVTNIYRECLI